MDAAEPRTTSLPEAGGRLGYIFRTLRHREFRLFLAGQFVSLIGMWMQNMAQSWLVYRLTGSSLLLGATGFAGQLPVLFLAPLGGAVADRFERRRIVLAAQVAMMLLAFALAALTLGGWVQIWQVILLATLQGVAAAFDVPARQSLFAELVGREDLMNAIALNSSMFNSARVVGPAIAGLIVARVGEGWCFLLNGLSYLAVISALLAIRSKRVDVVKEPAPASAVIIEGFRFAWQTRPVRALLLLVGAVSLLGSSYSVLMPVFAGSVLGGGARGLGLLMGASGAGALAGALTVAGRRGVKGLGRWVAASCAGFGVAVAFFAQSRSYWLSATLVFAAGCALMLQMASSKTLIQVMTPDVLRGRVMALYSMMLLGMAPLGSLAAGVLAQSLGAPTAVTLGGIAAVAGAVVFHRRWRDLRAEARELLLAQTAVAGEPAAPTVPVAFHKPGDSAPRRGRD
ncbi:MAG: MFS transporter [Bryobacterales bacterium]|nr:MFS transporter [Bryobacteraceae bacterium]MDW8356108.1 MFS transporter [Bryobacterales bacterium]